MRSLLACMSLVVLATLLTVYSVTLAYAETGGESLPTIKVVVKPRPLRAGVGEPAKLELYLTLSRDLNGSLCIDVIVHLDKGSFILDRNVLAVEGMYVNELGNATEWYCSYAYGEVWEYGDKHIYIRIRAANVSKGVHKFAEIFFTPVKRGKYYMVMTAEIAVLNLTIKCYDNRCYRVLEILDRSMKGGYIPIVITKALTENIAIATAGILLGFSLSLTLQTVIPQHQQYWTLLGTLTVLASLIVLLYLLGLLTPPTL